MGAQWLQSHRLQCAVQDIVAASIRDGGRSLSSVLPHLHREWQEGQDGWRRDARAIKVVADRLSCEPPVCGERFERGKGEAHRPFVGVARERESVR